MTITGSSEALIDALHYSIASCTQSAFPSTEAVEVSMKRITFGAICLASALTFVSSNAAFSDPREDAEHAEKQAREQAEHVRVQAEQAEKAKRDAAEAAEQEKRANAEQKANAGR
jgi:hypothetical protein